jgi:2-hydroxychromene-2-carboxylate isomerase
MHSRPVLDFWFDFASTYSYLSAMRIEALAQEAGIDVNWRPFLLGPIFAAQGWTSSPFNLYPVKGRYMWRDMARIAGQRGLRLQKPDLFPQPSLSAARIATAGREAGWIGAFSRALFALEFGEGRSISEEATLVMALKAAGTEPNPALAAARSEDVKSRLKAETELAKSLGIFGAPSFVAPDGEMFWGDDRLEQALGWAVSGR